MSWVVDDEPRIRTMLQRYLVEEGLQGERRRGRCWRGHPSRAARSDDAWRGRAFPSPLYPAALRNPDHHVDREGRFDRPRGWARDRGGSRPSKGRAKAEEGFWSRPSKRLRPTADAKSLSTKDCPKDPSLFADEPFRCRAFALCRACQFGKPTRELRELCAGSLRVIPVSAAKHMAGQGSAPGRLQRLW
jgi:hypothetical protein